MQRMQLILYVDLQGNIDRFTGNGTAFSLVETQTRIKILTSHCFFSRILHDYISSELSLYSLVQAPE